MPKDIPPKDRKPKKPKPEIDRSKVIDIWDIDGRRPDSFKSHIDPEWPEKPEQDRRG